jgi:hypothetical protein
MNRLVDEVQNRNLMSPKPWSLLIVLAVTSTATSEKGAAHIASGPLLKSAEPAYLGSFMHVLATFSLGRMLAFIWDTGSESSLFAAIRPLVSALVAGRNFLSSAAWNGNVAIISNVSIQPKEHEKLSF